MTLTIVELYKKLLYHQEIIDLSVEEHKVSTLQQIQPHLLPTDMVDMQLEAL